MVEKFRNLLIEEKSNVLSHFIALLLFIVLGIILLTKEIEHHRTHIFIGYATFLLMTVLTYFSSVRYHLSLKREEKQIWRRIDHICIYLLIGGSYTAFILRFMYTEKGLWFLALHWLIIVLGILKKVWFTGRFEILSLISYLFLGWMVVFIYDDIVLDMNVYSYNYLWMGAIFYTVGIIFYKWESLKFNHLIWHIFVIGGTLCHFLSVLYS